MDTANPNTSYSAKGYAVSGKIMLSAIVILFFVVIMMVVLHLYARWYLLNSRRRQLLRTRNRRTSLIFYNPNNTAYASTVSSSGLDSAVLNALPVFVYSSKTHPDSIECAVCLSEFEENESGRTLPKCNHSFHIECIDMWFHSHSTCPLCRASVEVEQVVDHDSVREIEPGSGLCVTCRYDESHVIDVVPSTSSFNSRIGVTIQVPKRNGSFEDESTTGSPSNYRSPVSRMLSLRRILSREKREYPSSPVSCCSGSGSGNGGSLNESDVEKGRDETSQIQSKLDSDSIM